MVSAKQRVTRVLEQLPDDCTLEDVLYQVYVVETIQQRLHMAETADLVPQAAVEEQFKEWLTR